MYEFETALLIHQRGTAEENSEESFEAKQGEIN